MGCTIHTSREDRKKEIDKSNRREGRLGGMRECKERNEKRFIFIYLRQNNFLFRHFCWPSFHQPKERIFPFVTQFCNFFPERQWQPESLFSVLYLVSFCVCICVYMCVSKAIYLDSDFGQQQQQTATEAAIVTREKYQWRLDEFSICHPSSFPFIISLLTKKEKEEKQRKKKRKGDIHLEHERSKGYSRLDINVTNPSLIWTQKNLKREKKTEVGIYCDRILMTFSLSISIDWKFTCLSVSTHSSCYIATYIYKCCDL